MKKNTLTYIFSMILIALWLICFYHINKYNYGIAREITLNTIEHPEHLPTKESAKYLAFWFQNIKADFYRLQAIQYIGWNALNSEYKKYLYQILDVITELNPYFENPYTIWQLLIPSYNQRYEVLSEEKQDENKQQALALSIKWIKNFCDPEKLILIDQENNLQNIWTQERYSDPCKSYKIPFNMWFIYYHHLSDWEKSSDFYKLASAHTEAPEWAKIMTAIMQGKWGQRDKAFSMFVNMALVSGSEEDACYTFASELSRLKSPWSSLRLYTPVIAWIHTSYNNTFWNTTESTKSGFESTQCLSYLQKAIRELNLLYIEQWHTIFVEEKERPAVDALELFNSWYIDFLPVDHQQYENQGIKYVYDSTLWRFDVKMQLH